MNKEKIKFWEDLRARENKWDHQYIFAQDNEQLIRERILQKPSEESLKEAVEVDLAMRLYNMASRFSFYIEDKTEEVVPKELDDKYHFTESFEHANKIFSEHGTNVEELSYLYSQIFLIRDELKVDEKIGQGFSKRMYLTAVANLLDSKKQN